MRRWTRRSGNWRPDQGAAEGLRRAPDEAKKARGLGAAQGGVAGASVLSRKPVGSLTLGVATCRWSTCGFVVTWRGEPRPW